MDGAPRPIAWTAALKLSKGYRLQGRYGMAQETYKACLANAPDPVARARCMYEMALTASFIENWELVEQLLTEVIETRGLPAEDKSVAAFLLADSWISQERIPEAVALLTEIKDDYPNPMAVEARLGQLEK
jgi:tetratricopeptide (TPR) repeat protein